MSTSALARTKDPVRDSLLVWRLAGGAGRFGAGTFGRRRLCKRNPWRRTVIKCICYYRNTLFSSIQLLF